MQKSAPMRVHIFPYTNSTFTTFAFKYLSVYIALKKYLINYQIIYLKCVPYLTKFLPQNVFTSPLFLPCSSGISNVALSNLPVALSSLNLLQISVHFIQINTCLWVLTGIADNQMYRPNLADNSLRD